jgi:hypothetical protein
MSNDESPVDVAATSAAAPGDEAPRGDAAAEPASATPTAASRRRRTTTPNPRPTRSRKTTNQEAGTTTAESSAPIEAAALAEPAVAQPAPATVEEPAAPAAKRPARRTTSRKRAADEAPSLSLEAPDAAPVSTTETPAAFAESPVVAPPDEAPSVAPSEAPTRPTRRRATRRGAVEAVAEPPIQAEAPAAPLEVEAPVAEATTRQADTIPTEPTAEPATGGRRRTTRGRRRGGSEPQAPLENFAPVVEQTEARPIEVEGRPVEAAVMEIAPEGPVEAPGGRRRRTATAPRKRAETPVEPDRGARLVTRKGVVDLVINGRSYPPVLFFGNMEGQKEQRRVVSQVQRAAQAGVHIHSTLVELICPLPPDDTVYETLDSRLQALLEADPQGYLIPRIVFVPAHGWRKQYPNEVNHYADGSTDDPSIASDLFWREAESALRAVVEHVRRMTYGERVIGYHLERGEWFHPADGGYDRSYANREAFRNWLRHKYRNSEAALRASWYDGQVQFYTAEIPAAPTGSRTEQAFFEPRKDRRTIDFLEYTSEITADRLIALSRAIKEASSGQLLVSVCYGYTFEFGHTFSGHLALGKVLESPAVDIISGPPSYRDRQAGGAGSLPSPVHSCAVHGKLWVTEDDTKTYLAPSNESPDDFNPRVENRFFTEQVQARAIGKTLAFQSGISWMDTWGEGWLDAGDVWEGITGSLARYAAYAPHRKQPTPEVVFVVGEKSLLHVQRGEPFVRRILQEHRELAQKCGASVGFYLQSDLTARAFPTDARLYIFLTPYRLTPEQRIAIKEKLQGGGRTLVWLFAPGTCDARGEPGESAHDVVGITLRQQSWNSEVGSRIVESRHPIVQQMQQKTVGVRERLNPSFYVDDDNPKLTTLAEYQQSGLPSIAVREVDSWRSVFCGEPTLSLDLLRGLCRYTGAHLFTAAGDDYLFAGDGWVTLHAVRDGQKTLFLPSPLAVYDLTEDRYLGEDLREVRFFAKARTTHNLYVGTPEMLRKLGFPGVEKATRGRRGRAAKVEEVVETRTENVETLADVLAPSISHLPEESDAIAPALLEGDVSLELSPGDAEDEANPDNDASADGDQERHRRRRRRGGRGRGRRGGRGGSPAGSPTGETPPG